MIELNSKTQQDFLNREWAQRLLDAGVDMSDAKYIIAKSEDYGNDYILNSKIDWDNPQDVECSIDRNGLYFTTFLPTYTVSELLYKLHEWIYPTIDGIAYSGGLKMVKDAPFYICWYDLKNKFTEEGQSIENYIYAEFEYPIESLASLLIQCHKKDIGLATKDTGNISNK